MLLNGCAISWVDRQSGAEHVLGIGLLTLKETPRAEGVRSIMRGWESIGVSGGNIEGHDGVSVGWQRVESVKVLDESSGVRYEWKAWPARKFTSMRVGTQFPVPTSQPTTNQNQVSE